MKEFFKTCLDDLESLTGLRQLYFLQIDQQDGKRKIEVLIKGMLVVSAEFSYIPEEAQKKIIGSQMIQDQEYQALNSRIIWKWLNAYKAPYLNPKELQDKPVVFEPLKPETEKMIEDFKNSLLDFGGKKMDVSEEMRKIVQEDRARVERPESLSVHYKPKPKDPREQKIRDYILKTKGIHWMGSRDFEMDGLKFRCDSEEDGYEIFVEALR